MAGNAASVQADLPASSIPSTETASSSEMGLALGAVAAPITTGPILHADCAEIVGSEVRLAQEVSLSNTGFRAFEFIAQICNKPKKQRVEMVHRKNGIDTTLTGTLMTTDDEGPWIAWDNEQKPGKYAVVSCYPPTDAEVIDFKFLETKLPKTKTRRVEVEDDDDDEETAKPPLKKTASTPVAKPPPKQSSEKPPSGPPPPKPPPKSATDINQMDTANLTATMTRSLPTYPPPTFSTAADPSTWLYPRADSGALSFPKVPGPSATLPTEQSSLHLPTSASASLPGATISRLPATMSADPSAVHITTAPAQAQHGTIFKPSMVPMSTTPGDASALFASSHPAQALAKPPATMSANDPFSQHSMLGSTQFPTHMHHHHGGFHNMAQHPFQFQHQQTPFQPQHFAPYQQHMGHHFHNAHQWYPPHPSLAYTGGLANEDFAETLLTHNLRRSVALCEGLRVPATVDHPYTALYPNLMVGAAGGTIVDWRQIWKELCDRLAVSFKDPSLRDAFDLHRDTLLVLAASPRPGTKADWKLLFAHTANALAVAVEAVHGKQAGDKVRTTAADQWKEGRLDFEIIIGDLEKKPRQTETAAATSALEKNQTALQKQQQQIQAQLEKIQKTQQAQQQQQLQSKQQHFRGGRGGGRRGT